eukprot:SAG31_NODE_15608_length_747_cov_0.785494_1_plen_212_part_10
MHQQALVQISRTERWIDDCCNPVLQSLSVYQRARSRFLNVAAVELQREHPETFALLYSEAHSLAIYRQDADGSLWLKDPLTKVFDPHRPKTSTKFAEDNGFALLHYSNSAEAMDVSYRDLMVWVSKPYCDWLPTFIAEMLGSDPNSILAHQYRSHIRCEVLPRLRQISDVLTSQGAIVELPSKEWLYTKCALHSTFVFCFLGPTMPRPFDEH